MINAAGAAAQRSRARRVPRTRALACAAAVLSGVTGLAAQEPDTTGQPAPVVVDTTGAGVWNGSRALALIESARERRQAPLADTALDNYRARAEGFVYFYIDRRDSDERTLVKIDQVALDIFWAQPDRTKQRIVGMRDVSRLPNRMYYHLDHLSVVQNGFGDIIRMGDGDEVQDVLHPAARGSEDVYDFRLTDSLTLVLPGAPEPVRVYEVQVRPRMPDRSGFVGSVFIDRARGDVVRMTFTFTPASYVDRRLDYINVSLDSGLWEGRYWLPYEQAVELRRQVPELDFVGGAVIRGRMRIGDYAFNEEIPETTFRGPPVTTVSPESLARFQFERDLYADLSQEGLAPPPAMAQLRSEAARLLRQERLSGLPELRFNVPSASSVARYNRLEGAFLGGGVTYTPSPDLRMDATLGFALGMEEPSARVGARFSPESVWDITAAAYYRSLRDVGYRSGMPGAINTLTSIFDADDYSDPYHASGGQLGIDRRLGGWTLGLEARRERHYASPLFGNERIEPLGVSGEDGFTRTLPAIDDGTLTAGRLRLERTAPEFDAVNWGAELSAEPGTLDGEAYLRLVGEGSLRYLSDDFTTTALLRLAGGAIDTSSPRQRQFLIGGRETLPGYEYRAFGGTTFGLLNAEVARDLIAPWLRVRVLGAAGWTNASRSARLPRNPELIDPLPGGSIPFEPIPDTDGVLTSVGAGVGLLWDQLRVDAVRGLNSGGEWQLLLSVARDFWSMM